MPTVLDKIVARKREEIAEAKRQRPIEALRKELPGAPPIRDFVGSLRSKDGVALIAEIKKASPSAGIIREGFEPVAIAKIYEQHGAACISVLTDEPFFQGKLEYLQRVRETVAIPLLRKDFILDEYQLIEARVAGADCVLLIAECLSSAELANLYRATRDLGMHALIELYDRENLEAVLAVDPPLVGVNNRDLRTFVTDLDHTVRLSKHMPADTFLVAESGIRTREDVLRLQSAGVRGMLVGETLMRSPDIGAKIDELLGA